MYVSKYIHMSKALNRVSMRPDPILRFEGVTGPPKRVVSRELSTWKFAPKKRDRSQGVPQKKEKSSRSTIIQCPFYLTVQHGLLPDFQGQRGRLSSVGALIRPFPRRMCSLKNMFFNNIHMFDQKLNGSK